MKGLTGASRHRNPTPRRPLLSQQGKKGADLGFVKHDIHEMAEWQRSSSGSMVGQGVNWATWNSTSIKSLAA